MREDVSIVVSMAMSNSIVLKEEAQVDTGQMLDQKELNLQKIEEVGSSNKFIRNKEGIQVDREVAQGEEVTLEDVVDHRNEIDLGDVADLEGVVDHEDVVDPGEGDVDLILDDFNNIIFIIY